MKIAEYQPRPAVGDIWHDEQHTDVKVIQIEKLSTASSAPDSTSIRFQLSNESKDFFHGLREDLFVKKHHAPVPVYLRAAKQGDKKARDVLVQVLFTQLAFADLSLMLADPKTVADLLAPIVDKWIEGGTLAEAAKAAYPDDKSAAKPDLKVVPKEDVGAQSSYGKNREDRIEAERAKIRDDYDRLRRTRQLFPLSSHVFTAPFGIPSILEGMKPAAPKPGDFARRDDSAEVKDVGDKTRARMAGNTEKRQNRHDRRNAKIRKLMTETAYTLNDGSMGAIIGKPTEEQVKWAIQLLVNYSHGNAKVSGWWDRHYKDGVSLVNAPGERATGRQRPFSELNALMHSEHGEALEYDRKGGKDTHLPNADGRTVELMDALHRIFDTLGATQADLSTFYAKGEYNLARVDHKIEVRAATGGKTY